MTTPNRKPGAKPAPYKKGDLDRPFVPGDSIPAPLVVEKSADSGWALWEEINKQQERRFADTQPASSTHSLTGEERGWARTAPVELPPREGMPRQKQPVLNIDAAMLVARRNNRVCPRQERWEEFYRLLLAQQPAGKAKPPAPATGAAWSVTPSLTKRLCFREQVEWADRHGLLGPVMEFMVALDEGEWFHMGEG